MKIQRIISTIAVAASLAAPVAAQAKDRHHQDVHISQGSHSSYYHGGYSGYRPYPYYYSRPSVGFSFYSRPTTIYRSVPVGRNYADGLSVDVQRELRRRGYYRGPIDGDIGYGSRAAIRSYQHDRGLSATGRIDSTLLRSLGIN